MSLPMICWRWIDMLRIPVSGSLMIAMPEARKRPPSFSETIIDGMSCKSASSPLRITSLTGALPASTSSVGIGSRSRSDMVSSISSSAMPRPIDHFLRSARIWLQACQPVCPLMLVNRLDLPKSL